MTVVDGWVIKVHECVGRNKRSTHLQIKRRAIYKPDAFMIVNKCLEFIRWLTYYLILLFSIGYCTFTHSFTIVKLQYTGCEGVLKLPDNLDVFLIGRDINIISTNSYYNTHCGFLREENVSPHFEKGNYRKQIWFFNINPYLVTY